MELTSKQRAKLRGMAQAMEPVLHIGKEELTDNVIRQAEDALTARELIKGTVQQNCPLTARDACDALCEATGAQPVGVIGRKFVLYRASKDKKKIEL
ncbi:MAG TPA: ribosome assembly RNA-binding protein YhbY [Clostridiales bacterium]|nr:ribosome assembly RNA-binding protein YhbY [Clostridiales bacterium]